jgi:hypothetical protein
VSEGPFSEVLIDLVVLRVFLPILLAVGVVVWALTHVLQALL